MEAIRRFVYILLLQLCFFYIISTDSATSKNAADLREFQAQLVANLDDCNLKIKITDPKYSSSLDGPLVISKSSDFENTPPTPYREPIKGEKGDVGQRGNQGEPGPEGKSGQKGQKGDTGTPGEQGKPGPEGKVGQTGEKGATGTPGNEGEPGPEGKSGQKGQKGDTGTPGEQGKPGPEGKVGQTGEKGATGAPGNEGEPGPEGKSGQKGQKGDTGTPGEQGKPGPEGKIGQTGEKGATGAPGSEGKPGPEGKVGQTGEKGATGAPGSEGKPGPEGKLGQTGEKGATGAPGSEGKPGPEGNLGQKGQKGDTGTPGEQGDKGPAGPPGKDCTIDHDDGGIRDPEETAIKLGLFSHPAKSCADIRETGEFYINPIKPFKVHCNKRKSEMCLVLEPMDDLYSNLERKSKKFDNYPFWINFNFADLYKILESQMSYALSQSTGVRQTIKYHCMNNEVAPEDKSKSLLLHLWSGQLVGPAPSRETPMKYIVEKDSCNESKDTWQSAIIRMETNFIHQLPILDIYVQDIRKGKNQKYYIQLEELCFSYNKAKKRT